MSEEARHNLIGASMVFVLGIMLGIDIGYRKPVQQTDCGARETATASNSSVPPPSSDYGRPRE